MRPLFLFCRASGASIKYLYDKTFDEPLFGKINSPGEPRDESTPPAPALRCEYLEDPLQKND